MNRYNKYMERVSISEEAHNKIMSALMDANAEVEPESISQHDRSLQYSGASAIKWKLFGQWAAVIILGVVILSLLVFRTLSTTDPTTPTLAGNEMHDIYLIKPMDDGGEKGGKLNQKETETILYWLKNNKDGTDTSTDSSATLSSAFRKTTLNDGEVVPYGVYLYVNDEIYVLIPENADVELISFFEAMLNKFGLNN